jgi:hypothetical protein
VLYDLHFSFEVVVSFLNIGTVWTDKVKHTHFKRTNHRQWDEVLHMNKGPNEKHILIDKKGLERERQICPLPHLLTIVYPARLDESREVLHEKRSRPTRHHTPADRSF